MLLAAVSGIFKGLPGMSGNFILLADIVLLFLFVCYLADWQNGAHILIENYECYVLPLCVTCWWH